jgi:hypothetical protein
MRYSAPSVLLGVLWAQLSPCSTKAGGCDSTTSRVCCMQPAGRASI